MLIDHYPTVYLNSNRIIGVHFPQRNFSRYVTHIHAYGIAPTISMPPTERGTSMPKGDAHARRRSCAALP
jgi:hypothetical protein